MYDNGHSGCHFSLPVMARETAPLAPDRYSVLDKAYLYQVHNGWHGVVVGDVGRPVDPNFEFVHSST
jgi:hypothetical protein